MSALAIAVLAIWIGLVAFRGGFWTCRIRDDADAPEPTRRWPGVVAVVPARDEADVIETCLGSMLDQNYAGDFHIVLVDDQSSDGTAERAKACAEARNAAQKLTVLTGVDRPSGWTGKLWAVKQGIDFARAKFAPTYLLLTDADIAHTPENLAALTARAEAGGYALVSLMARLACESFAEKALIPAFVYFFQMLYPFAYINDPKAKTAGAAGGCMLARADALAQAGGIEAIKGALIDDCALGGAMKRQGPIWLGLTERASSVRPYPRFADIGKMIARSAYAQLNYSPWLLIGSTLGMALTFVGAPFLASCGGGLPRDIGVFAYALMALSFMPILRFYRLSRLWALALPLIALVYMVYTLESALAYWQGRGGMWKGRAQAERPRTS